MWHGYGCIACKWWDPDLSHTWIPYKETMKTDSYLWTLLVHNFRRGQGFLFTVRSCPSSWNPDGALGKQRIVLSLFPVMKSLASNSHDNWQPGTEVIIPHPGHCPVWMRHNAAFLNQQEAIWLLVSAVDQTVVQLSLSPVTVTYLEQGSLQMLTLRISQRGHLGLKWALNPMTVQVPLKDNRRKQRLEWHVYKQGQPRNLLSANRF